MSFSSSRSLNGTLIPNGKTITTLLYMTWQKWACCLFFTFLLCSVTQSLKHLPVHPIYTCLQTKGISYTTPNLQLPAGSLYFFKQPVFFLRNGVKRVWRNSFQNTTSMPKPRVITFRLYDIMWKNRMATLWSREQILGGVTFFDNLRMMTSCSKSKENPDAKTCVTTLTNEFVASCRHDWVKAQWTSVLITPALIC